MNNIGDPELIRYEIELLDRCDELISDLGRLGREKAEAEYNYSRQKTITAFEMKDQGHSATFIQQTLKGQPEVARLMLERDTKESEYDAVRETINILKYQIKVVENQISREWCRSE